MYTLEMINFASVLELIEIVYTLSCTRNELEKKDILKLPTRDRKKKIFFYLKKEEIL